MAKGGKIAKTASKNNPTQRKKGTAQKLYGGKAVKPVMYIDRAYGKKYVAAQYTDGSMVENASGNPFEWASI